MQTRLPKRFFSATSQVSKTSGKIIDLRSDTVTRPSQRMFEAMSQAELGDIGREDCPTTIKLEQKIAELFGKEASLLVPSGIMANNLNLKLMAGLSGESVLIGSNSHAINNERGGISSFASIMPWIVQNNADGTMPLDLVKR